MSWYVGKDGAHLWIKRDETVYTVIQPEDSLPIESLTYLALNSRKSVYQEHLINDDAGDVKNNSKRRREKQSGRQRGYVVRIEQEEQLRVVPSFKAAALKLLDDDVVSRVDADEAANLKKKKNKPVNVSSLTLGVNECRVETSSRIHHFAHGPGFRVEVSEGSVHQKIHFFTNRKEMACKDWHSHLVAAVESTGSHVMLARRTQVEASAEASQEDLQSKAAADLIERVRSLRKDNAQKDDDAWLESVMNAKVEESASSDAGSSADDDPPEKSAPTVANGTGLDKSMPVVQATQPSRSGAELPEWRRREQTTAAAKQQQQRQTQQPSKQQSKHQQSKQEQKPKWQPSSIQQLLRQQMLEGQQPSGQPPTRQQQPPPRLPQPPTRQQPQQQPPSIPQQQPSRQAPQYEQPHVQHQQQSHYQQEQFARQHEPLPSQKPQEWEQQWWQTGELEHPHWQRQQQWWHTSDQRHEEEYRWQKEEQQRWQPSARLAPEKSDPQRHDVHFYASSASGSIVDQLFSRARVEEEHKTGERQERRAVPVEREVRQQASACGECGRGRPLKLFMDPDDSQWYCRVCWVEFYGKEPPGK